MSHRGVCPFCCKIIWMGQPCIWVHQYLLHQDCEEWYSWDLCGRDWDLFLKNEGEE